MSYEYLANLPLSDEERTKLKSLAAPDIPTLLSIIKASSDAFYAFFGKERTQVLKRILESRVDRVTTEIINACFQNTPATGAIVGVSAPDIPPPKYDIKKRDQMFDELQSLRKQNISTPEITQRIARLEQDLNRLLEKNG